MSDTILSDLAFIISVNGDVHPQANLSTARKAHAEIASLRAELAETQAVLLASAATGARHMDQVADLRAELAREAEQTKIVLDNYAAENQRFSDEIQRLREALERISSCDGLGLGDVLDIAQAALVPRAAARQDAEEIARLRDIIRRALAYHEAEELELIEAWIDDARAALAPRPQEEKP